jgi:hypothetical protein
MSSTKQPSNEKEVGIRVAWCVGVKHQQNPDGVDWFLGALNHTHDGQPGRTPPRITDGSLLQITRCREHRACTAIASRAVDMAQRCNSVSTIDSRATPHVDAM